MIEVSADFSFFPLIVMTKLDVFFRYYFNKAKKCPFYDLFNCLHQLKHVLFMQKSFKLKNYMRKLILSANKFQNRQP